MTNKKVKRVSSKILDTKKEKAESSSQKSSLGLVVDRFTNAKSYRQTSSQDEIWERSYKNWRGELDASIYPWRSKLFIPWSFTVVETIIPRVFARDPKWRAIPRNPEDIPSVQMEQSGINSAGPVRFSDPTASSKVISDLLSYQWDRMGMRLKMYDYIKDSLMYSKGIAKVTWSYKRKTKKRVLVIPCKSAKLGRYNGNSLMLKAQNSDERTKNE